MKNNREVTIVIILFMIVGFFMLTPIIVEFLNPVLYGEKIETLGTIMNIEKNKNSEGEISYVTDIKYNVKNNEQIKSLQVGFKDEDIGKKIRIYYYKNKPEKIGMEELDKNNSKKGIIFGIFAMPYLFIAIAFLTSNIKAIIKDKRLQKYGKIIFAKIKQIKKENNVYYIICEWKNYEDDIVCEFKSEWLSANPKNIINKNNIKELPVCINKNNIKEFKVDITIISLIEEIEDLKEMKNHSEFSDAKEQIEEELYELQKELEQKTKIDERNKYYQ